MNGSDLIRSDDVRERHREVEGARHTVTDLGGDRARTLAGDVAVELAVEPVAGRAVDEQTERREPERAVPLVIVRLLDGELSRARRGGQRGSGARCETHTAAGAGVVRQSESLSAARGVGREEANRELPPPSQTRVERDHESATRAGRLPETRGDDVRR